MNDARVLLLDRSAATTGVMLRDTLRQHEILAHVTVASDGSEALDYLYGTRAPYSGTTLLPPHLVLLDLCLPRIGGLDLLRIIRADHRTRWVPVIVLADAEGEGDVVEAYRRGANSVLLVRGDPPALATALAGVCKEWLHLTPEAATRKIQQSASLTLSNERAPLTLSLMADTCDRLMARIPSAGRHALLDTATGLSLLAGRLETVWRDAAPLFEAEGEEVDAIFARARSFTPWLQGNGHLAGEDDLRVHVQSFATHISAILQTLRTSRVSL